MQNLFSQLLSIGAVHAQTDRQRRKFRVTMGVFLGVIPPTVASVFFLVGAREWFFAGAVGAVLGVYLALVWLLARGKHLAARAGLAYAFTIGVWGSAVLLGVTSRLEYLLLYGSFFPFAIFEVHERRYAYSFSAFSLILFASCFVIPRSWVSGWAVSIPHSEWLSVWSLVSAHAVVFSAVASSFGLAERYEDALIVEHEEKTLAQRQAAEKDWALTASVQRLFLPKQHSFVLQGFPGLRGVASYKPAQSCSGDWWWWSEGVGPQGPYVDLLIGDVTGHGPASAMITAAMSNTFQVLLAQQWTDPVGMSRFLNQSLWDLCRGEFLFCLSWVRLTPQNGAGIALVAGTPPPAVLSSDGKARFLFVDQLSAPLGSTQFEPHFTEFPFLPGDRLFLVTDGVTGLRESLGRELGLRRTLRLIEESARRASFPASSEELWAQDFDAALDRFQGNQPALDDRTWLSVTWSADSPQVVQS